MALKRYVVLLASVGVVRLVELGISRRHRRALAARGITMAAEPHFRWMVLLHVGVLTGSALEAALAKRAPPASLTTAMGMALLGANLLRWWVIRTLGEHWNVRVM